MPDSYSNHHPSPELLEKFAMRHCTEQELDILEPHILACDFCVSALEQLDGFVIAFKSAVALQRAEQMQPETQPKHNLLSSWRRCCSTPTFMSAGAALVAVALWLLVVTPCNVTLQANRGAALMTVPQWRNVRMHLVCNTLGEMPLNAEVVDQTGTRIWSGVVAKAKSGGIDLNIPRFPHIGNYYARLYSTKAHDEFAAEFPFEVK